MGITGLKLTGGEPLLREDIVRVVSEVSKQVGDVSCTTNGTLLKPLAGELKQAGSRRVNVSLDSLNSRLYERMTGGGRLEEAIEGIDAAVAAGLRPLKLTWSRSRESRWGAGRNA